MARIYIIGLTTVPMGAMEKQLGNMAIFEPMIKMLRRYVIGADIYTNLQLSEECQKALGFRSLEDKRFWRWTEWQAASVLFDLLRSLVWCPLRRATGLDAAFLVRGVRLDKYREADVILAFNGDMFGDNMPSNRRLIKQCVDVLTAWALGKPVVEFAGSPGPFSTRFKRALARFVLERTTVVTNREARSSEILKEIGVTKVPVITTACPALLLEPASKERGREILRAENVDTELRPLIGVTLCGFNLHSERTWDVPKSLSDVRTYLPLLGYLLNDLKANVVLLPHVYRVNPWTGEMIHGPDWLILSHLYKLAHGGDRSQGRITLIDGAYAPSEAKSVIGQFDLYVSGRLHAGAAGLTQGVPTVYLAYGHKHFGFAELFGQERYVYGGSDSERIVSLVNEAWEKREQIAAVLRERIPRVQELAKLNFRIVKDIVELDDKTRVRIPRETVASWIRMAAQDMGLPRKRSGIASNG